MTVLFIWSRLSLLVHRTRYRYYQIMQTIWPLFVFKIFAMITIHHRMQCTLSLAKGHLNYVANILASWFPSNLKWEMRVPHFISYMKDNWLRDQEEIVNGHDTHCEKVGDVCSRYPMTHLVSTWVRKWISYWFTPYH